MTRQPAAPMPTSIRDVLRAKQHPARSVACPRCGAHENRPCTSPSRRRVMPEPHPSRVTAWATQTACCPACQVTPGVPCHLDGMPLHHGHVHPQREEEARRTAA